MTLTNENYHHQHMSTRISIDITTDNEYIRPLLRKFQLLVLMTAIIKDFEL